MDKPLSHYFFPHRCPNCKRGLNVPPATVRMTCSHCDTRIAFALCKPTGWTGPVSLDAPEWKHDGCSIQHTSAPLELKVPVVLCPFCRTNPPNVTSKVVTVKGRISPGKLSGALLTGGTSLLATGLAHKENRRVYTCLHCEKRW